MIGKFVRTSALWRRISPPPAIRPIMLAPWGRNGSTLLMSLLATSPDVLVPEPYPFERHQILHFLRAAQVLAGASSAPRKPQSSLMTDVFDGVVAPIEGLPIGTGDRQALVADLLAGMWDGWVANLSASAQAKPSLRYYAEKSSVEAARELGSRRSGYCIFVSRDPRDLFASSKAFNQSRGNFEFGWNENAGPGFVQGVIDEMTRTLEMFEALPSAIERIVIRYEDLILPGSPAVAGLAGRLGITITPGRAAGIPAAHRTAASPAQSVGRWAKDLPPGLAGEIRRRGDRLFKRLGYD